MGKVDCVCTRRDTRFLCILNSVLLWSRVNHVPRPCGCASDSHPYHPHLCKETKKSVHPREGLMALRTVSARGSYQLIPVIIGALQTNSWKPIKATYYVITSPLSPETPL